jgi:ribonucleoside-diphosphate reductase alpha chain
MSPEDKAVFKTAFELDQHWVVEQAAKRQEFICQAQSVNLFFPAGVDKSYVNSVHLDAWKKGLKTLYYLRTTSGVTVNVERKERIALKDGTNSDECLSCSG